MANFNFFLNRQGIQGRKGEKGDTGFSPTISVGTDTLDEYKLIIANESNSFETPNLRGNINIQDNGGTYLRYDTETKQISAQSIDAATADTLGGVRLSTEADIVEMGADSVVTPSDVADALPLYLEGEGAVTITQDELTSKTKIKVDVSSVNDLESRMSTAEAEIADIQTDVADLNNNKVAKTDLATTESAGIVKVDGTSITVTADGTISASPSDTLPIASTTQLGGVKVDGTSIIADKNGVISSVGGGSGTGDVPIATTETAGKVKPDGTTITITDDGTISAVAGGGSAPANIVTTNTDQDITGKKTIVNSDGLCFKSTNSSVTSATAQIVNTSSSISNTIGTVTILPNKSSGSRYGFARISYGILNDNNSNYPLYGKGGLQVTPVVDDTSAEARILLGSSSNGMGNIVGTTSGLTIGTGAVGRELSITPTDITFNGQSLLNSGGETPANMVTTDSDQTINGTKIFANGTGTTFTGTSSNSNSLTIDADDKEIRFYSANGSDAVIKNQGLNSTNLNIGDNFNSVKMTTTLYDKNGNEIIGGSSAPTNMVTTDTEQTITANKTFSASSVVTFGDGSAKTTIERNTFRIGGNNYRIALLPGVMNTEDGGSTYTGMITSKVGTINIVPDGKTQYNGDGLVIQKNSFRFNKNEVVTKSASDNEYMAHMSMPSTRFVNLTLGASGATYTAPADGYFCFVSAATTAAGQYCRLIIKSSQRLRQSCYSSGAKQYIEVLMPVSKGQPMHVYYTAPVSTFSFIYAEGAPSA